MTNTKKLRIIIIDDDPAINLLLKTALTKQGHHVLAFSDPTECSILKQTTHSCSQEFPCADVIISDIIMPRMTGTELFKLQRARGCKASMANKALISATTKLDHIEAAEELGCKFFGKPFKLVEMFKWIDGCAESLPENRVLSHLV